MRPNRGNNIAVEAASALKDDGNDRDAIDDRDGCADGRGGSAVDDPEPADLVEPEHELDTIMVQNLLYIGHSFGQPFARNELAAAELAGVEGHEQHIIFRSENGAPQAMWEAPDQQTIIEESARHRHRHPSS